MLGNMSKSLIQSCQGHYDIQSAAKYPCASSPHAHKRAHAGMFILFVRTMLLFWIHDEQLTVVVTFFLLYEFAERL